MDDVQVAITQVVQLLPLQPRLDLGTAILRLAFVAEFKSHFTPNNAIQVFTQACSIDHHPTADHLEPLAPYLAFVSLMMRYREGLRHPETAVWRSRWGSRAQPWLDEEFGRLGFKQNKQATGFHFQNATLIG